MGKMQKTRYERGRGSKSLKIVLRILRMTPMQCSNNLCLQKYSVHDLPSSEKKTRVHADASDFVKQGSRDFK